MSSHTCQPTPAFCLKIQSKDCRLYITTLLVSVSVQTLLSCLKLGLNGIPCFNLYSSNITLAKYICL